jgi:hypothetical protein
MPKLSQLSKRLSEATAIVLSILLAFAIDAAWQNRRERNEEARMLTALRDEFTVNQERLSEITAFHADLRATAQALMATGSQPASVSADSADQMITDVTWWGGFISFESAALDAVILSGKLDLLEDEGLRRLLTAWRRDIAAAASLETQEFAHFSEVWLPLLRAHANLAQIANTTTTFPGSEQAYHGVKIPVALTTVDHRALLRDREFQNALVQKAWIEDDVLRQYRLLEPQVVKLLQVLDREIKR